MAASREQLAQGRARRAQAIASAGGIEPALTSGVLERHIDTTLSEALVLGLLRQDVRIFVCVLGHGSTEVGEVLRIYQDAGLVRACGVRSEIEAPSLPVASWKCCSSGSNSSRASGGHSSPSLKG